MTGDFPGDGGLVPNYTAYCGKCDAYAEGLGRTEEFARKQLIELGWREIDGVWLCWRCQPSDR